MPKIAENGPKIGLFRPFLRKKSKKYGKTCHLRKKCAGWRDRTNFDGPEKHVYNAGQREVLGGIKNYDFPKMLILRPKIGQNPQFLDIFSKFLDIFSKFIDKIAIFKAELDQKSKR